MMPQDTVRDIMAEIQKLQKEKEYLVIAIDGRCASGKTTLAARLQEAVGCNVFHMDDFFLRPEQRTKERYDEPGGNVDRERFFTEVLEPLLRREPVTYRPYDCRAGVLRAPVRVPFHRINLVEGSYSCHPMLRDGYDLKIFLTTDPKEQLSRIERRNGREGLALFRERWIPMEERYFAECRIKENCDLVFDIP